MGVLEYLLGSACFVLVAGASSLAAAIVVRGRLGHVEPGARAAAAGLLVTAFLCLSALLPLLLGVLTRGTLAASAVLVALAVWRLVPRRDPGEREALAGAPGDRLGWALAGVAAGITLLHTVSFVLLNRTRPVQEIDSTSYIIPQLGRWLQSGSLWQSDNLVPDFAFGSYPGNGSLLHLVAVLPWRDDFLLRFVNLPFLVLAGLATYALACELGARRPLALSLAALAVVTPTAYITPLDRVHTDGPMAAMFLAGVLFLVRHLRTGARADLVLAGLGLGLAFGTKWYGPPEAAAVGLVWLVARRLRGSDWRPLSGDTLRLAGVVLAAGGVWLLRNLVEAGNPLMPAKVEILGIVLFDAPRDRIGEELAFSLTHYLTDFDAWREYILPAMDLCFAAGGWLLLAALPVAAVVAVTRRAAPESGRVLAVAAMGLLIIAVYMSLPYSALGPEGQPHLAMAATRYAFPAILLGAAVLAWAASAARPAGLALQALAPLGIVLAFTHLDDLGLEARLTDGLHLRPLVKAAVAMALAGAVAWVVLRLPARGRAAAAALLLAVAVVTGRDLQQDFDAKRYRGADPVLDVVLEGLPAGSRIAYAGVGARFPLSGQTVLFGDRFENEVDYVGRNETTLLQRHRDARSFLADLERTGADVLVVGDEVRRQSPETGWAAEGGWREIRRSRLYTLFVPPDA